MTQLNHRIINFFFIIAIINLVFYSCAPEQKPCDNVTDIDGNTYQVVRIGDQCWMAENLKVTRYRNGDPIPNITNDTTWENLSSGAYCDYNNNPANSSVYGRLYNWHAVSDSRNIAPVGWHIPTYSEWLKLENYLGGNTVAGVKMKVAIGNIPPWDGTNTSGFSALPAGVRWDIDGSFYELDTITKYWTATSYDASTADVISLNLGDSYSSNGINYKAEGISIRCIKDE